MAFDGEATGLMTRYLKSRSKGASTLVNVVYDCAERLFDLRRLGGRAP